MALVVTIQGVDRSAIVKHDTIRITQQADSYTFTAELTIHDEDSDINIVAGSRNLAGAAAVRSDITLVDGATTYFGGFVTNQTLELLRGGSRNLRLQCQGYGILLTETRVEFEDYAATSDKNVIDDLFDTYLPVIDEETKVATIDASMDISFSEMSLAEIMDAICQRTAGRWYVDNTLQLHYFAAEADDAGFKLSDTPDSNPVGANTWPYFAYPQRRTDATQIINSVRVIGADDFAQNRSDAGSITTYGTRQAIVIDSSLTSTAALQERGDAILAKYKDPKLTYTFDTYKAGAVAGNDIDVKCVDLELDALTTKTIRLLRIDWITGTPVYRMTLGEVEKASITRAFSPAAAIRRIETNANPLSSRGWGQDMVFTATDNDTVAWTSGTVTLAGGTGSYAIDAGNTGNMGATTYVYLDTSTSITVLQTTTSVDASIGLNQILLAVCQPVVADKDAVFEVYNGSDEVGLIVANHIASNSIETGHIVAAAVTTAKINDIAVTGAKLSIGENPFTAGGGIFLLGQPLRIEEVSSEHYVYGTRGERNTLVGAVHLQQGNFPGSHAIKIECATKNYFNNPVFGHATWDNGWVETGVNPPTAIEDTQYVRFGTSAAKVTFAGALSTFASNVVAVKATLDGIELTISAWVKTEAADVQIISAANFSTGLGNSASHPGDGQWHRLEVTITPAFDVGGTTTFINVGVTSNTNGAIAYCDGFQLELFGYATTLAVGDMGEGYTWDGTAHETASNRGVTALNPDAEVLKLLTGEEGSVSVRFKLPYDSGDGFTGFARIFEYGNFSTGPITVDWFAAVLDTTADSIAVTLNRGADGSQATVSGLAVSYVAEEPLHLVVTWDTDRMDVYWQGLLIGGVDDPPLWANYDFATWNVGAADNGGNNCSFLSVTEVATYGTKLTLDQISVIYNSQAPQSDPGTTDGPGIYITDGRFRLSSSTSGDRIEMTADEFALYNGADKVLELDSDGIAVLVDTTYADERSYQFKDGSDIVSQVRGFVNTGTPNNTIQMVAHPVTSSDAVASVRAESPASELAHVEALATHGGATFAAISALVSVANAAEIWLTIDGTVLVTVDAAQFEVDVGTDGQLQAVSGGIRGNGHQVPIIIETGTSGAGGIRPEKASVGTGYIGTSTYYWNEINYKTLADRGCLLEVADILDTEDGLSLSPGKALLNIKQSETVSPRTGLKQLDYKTFPSMCFMEGETTDKDIYEDGVLRFRKGEKSGTDGIDIGALISVMLKTINEQESRLDEQAETIADLVKRVEALEADNVPSL